MLAIDINYDRKFDVLYARVTNYSPSYGDEVDGIVTLYSIESDSITGMTIYNAKQRIQQGNIDAASLPLPIDLNALCVQRLLNEPDKGFRCTLQLV